MLHHRVLVLGCGLNDQAITLINLNEHHIGLHVPMVLAILHHAALDDHPVVRLGFRSLESLLRISLLAGDVSGDVTLWQLRPAIQDGSSLLHQHHRLLSLRRGVVHHQLLGRFVRRPPGPLHRLRHHQPHRGPPKGHLVPHTEHHRGLRAEDRLAHRALEVGEEDGLDLPLGGDGLDLLDGGVGHGLGGDQGRVEHAVTALLAKLHRHIIAEHGSSSALLLHAILQLPGRPERRQVLTRLHGNLARVQLGLLVDGLRDGVSSRGHTGGHGQTTDELGHQGGGQLPAGLTQLDVLEVSRDGILNRGRQRESHQVLHLLPSQSRLHRRQPTDNRNLQRTKGQAN
mmetsp:Transcript_35703/g.75725  ORF Transcript_35703/g.75725 Transcript_35703/m.75725 type:complete len:342 (-) Transcript_35703:1352-2377(-)